MNDNGAFRILTKREIELLRMQGCSAEDWGRIEVAEGFDPACVRNSHFAGSVRMGRFEHSVQPAGGFEKPSGVYDAVISNCTIGNDTRISNIGVHIANYDIGEHVCIENVATMQTRPQATFGNGVEISVLNEAGGREVMLFDRLSAQFAYLMCLHRYRPRLIEQLRSMAREYVESIRSDRGTVGAGATICSAEEIIDVHIGPFATISHASSLRNGTILSAEEAPTTIGVKVIAEDFIVAESSSVTGGAMLSKVFVGQGCQVGRQYSAENSAFFANCEAFHGEACSVFAGPYTVTHHKSTLLIAGLFSFYNAGSGTNQSNHMYKLGPAHEGKVLRGTKTGSFSYMMWPCRVGPFSVVLGKHSTTFDTGDFPFSHLEARSDGKCTMIAGFHLTTVGTVRDGAKWPKRDRRKGANKRDAISFDVFSPYTVGKMLKATQHLKHLQDTTDRSVEEVSIGGALVKRLMLRTSQKYYRTGIEMYLLEKVVARIEAALDDPPADTPGVAGDAVYSEDWVDIAGQLMPRKRLVDLEDALENGSVATLDAFDAAIAKILKHYANDEWAWVKTAYEQVFGAAPADLTAEGACEAARMLLKVKSKFLNLVTADAQKEFSESSRLGFGQDGDPDDAEKDFTQVRGLYEENQFVLDMKRSIEQLQQRIERIEKAIGPKQGTKSIRLD
jgi:hypothetical protein